MKTTSIFACVVVLMCCIPAAAALGDDVRHPRPAGYKEAGTVGAAAAVSFSGVKEDAKFTVDLTATFPKESVIPATVTAVSVNGREHDTFLVKNANIFNGHREIHGSEDISVSLYEGWQPGAEYAVEVTLAAKKGKAVTLSTTGTAPAERKATSGIGFAAPTAAFPYHQVSMTFAKEAIGPGTVTRVEVDGVWNRDARFFNEGIQDPASIKGSKGLEGETYSGEIDGSRSFRVLAPCVWTNGSKHTLKVVVADAEGNETVYEHEGTAPDSKGHWSDAWPYVISLVVHETAGIRRDGEPVHATIGPYADEFGPENSQIRVVTYDPTHPKAGDDGYVVAPHQIIDVTEWRDEAMLNSGEKDTETGELVHRYDPTTTVEFVFLADVQQYEKKVYQVLYGNPAAPANVVESDLGVTQHDALAQTIKNGQYAIETSGNSGAIEIINILGNGDPVLLEHKLETNGAVHWNPGVYSPPTPWVHVSDWEGPDFAQITGPLMHRTRRHAMLPFMDKASAHISYTFYAGQPYILQSSLLEVHEDMFVSALRNGEIVFNHAVLDEFVWLDEMGVVQHMEIEGSKEHPTHAMDFPADTPWMAFINREKKVGFANIALAYENTNRFGDPASVSQPYFYIQNGPWIYWARPLVYPFAGKNMTRLMKVRKGSMYYETNAWVPFRFAEGDNPYADIERLNRQLRSPLKITEWMPTDERAP
ncbi:MAG: hypothetical protein L3K26_17040, partial [Candidatus Hydrogenedentes bacterium]|nr:hypothetical protein [Candidatus Hydrogenedentota bacterium]